MFHLAVAGDVGEPGSRIDDTGAAITRIAEVEPFDALLLLGDNVYPDGNPAKLRRRSSDRSPTCSTTGPLSFP